MNSGPDAEPDLSDAEVSELDRGPLQDSQDAIDRGREAAREALQDDDDWTSSEPDEPTDAEADASGELSAEPDR